jgi:hypothetical protein
MATALQDYHASHTRLSEINPTLNDSAWHLTLKTPLPDQWAPFKQDGDEFAKGISAVMKHNRRLIRLILSAKKAVDKAEEDLGKKPVSAARRDLNVQLSLLREEDRGLKGAYKSVTGLISRTYDVNLVALQEAMDKQRRILFGNKRGAPETKMLAEQQKIYTEIKSRAQEFASKRPELFAKPEQMGSVQEAVQAFINKRHEKGLPIKGYSRL